MEDEKDKPVADPVQDQPVTPPAEPVTPPPADPAPAKPPVAPTPERDYDVEIAQKDAQIKQLTDDFLASKNSQHMSQAEIRKAQVALAEAIQERNKIEEAKEKELAAITEQLETVSQATQVLSKEKSDLTTELETQAAKAVKLEILTEEFPELLRYARSIQPSRDPEAVRAACRELAAARVADLEAQRIGAVTGNGMTQVPANPTRVEPVLTDPSKIRDYLSEAMHDPKEYERRRQLLLDQIDAAVARQQQGTS